MSKPLTINDLSSNFSDILDRVALGERYVIERDGIRLAELRPVRPEPGLTGRELSARLGDLMMLGDGLPTTWKRSRPSSPRWSCPRGPTDRLQRSDRIGTSW